MYLSYTRLNNSIDIITYLGYYSNMEYFSCLMEGNCIELCGNTAFVLGMLHDIGRRVGKTDMRHALDGYYFALEKGYDMLAKICLTHSFDCQDMKVNI